MFTEVNYSSETGPTIFELSFDLEQYVRLPVVQLRDLVKLKHEALEFLEIVIFDCLKNCSDKFGFTCRCKGDVLCVILLQIPSRCYEVLDNCEAR